MVQTPQKWLKLRPALCRAELYCTRLNYRSYFLIQSEAPQRSPFGGTTLPALIQSKQVTWLIIYEHYESELRGYLYEPLVQCGGTAACGGGEDCCCSSWSCDSARCRERPGRATLPRGQLVVSRSDDGDRNRIQRLQWNSETETEKGNLDRWDQTGHDFTVSDIAGVVAY